MVPAWAAAAAAAWPASSRSCGRRDDPRGWRSEAGTSAGEGGGLERLENGNTSVNLFYKLNQNSFMGHSMENHLACVPTLSEWAHTLPFYSYMSSIEGFEM